MKRLLENINSAFENSVAAMLTAAALVLPLAHRRDPVNHRTHRSRGLQKLLAAGIGLTLPFASLAVDPSGQTLKVAFVYVGAVSDGGWSYQHDLGRLALEDALGSKVKTTYVESVAEGADAERVIRRLASTGNTLIFTTSSVYMETTLKVAKLFPKVRFEHATAFKTAANVSAYEARLYEGAYLLGIIAGKMSKTNTLGFVASFPVPEVIRSINAYTLGARSVNPNIQTKVIYIDTWYDPGKERKAAETLIAQGADMLCQSTGSPAVVQVAEEKGVNAFGWNSDMSKYGPKAQLAANTENWNRYYIETAKKALTGSWEGGRITRFGIKEGAVVLTPLNPSVPADVAALFESKKQAIATGKLDPFVGPLKDNTGKLRVEPGIALLDRELAALNWYAEGVVGSIPQ